MKSKKKHNRREKYLWINLRFIKVVDAQLKKIAYYNFKYKFLCMEFFVYTFITSGK